MTRRELHAARRSFLKAVQLLKRLARDPRHRNPFVFIVASAFLDYLSKLAYGGGGAAEYKKFIRRYLARTRPRYRSFAYRFAGGNVTRDLPEQMYHVLRCGVIHGYSLIPDAKARGKGGRDRSIVIAHRQSKLRHLSLGYHAGEPTCVFIAEDFAKDIEAAIRSLFRLARTNKALAARIEGWLTRHPPIEGGLLITSRPK